MKQFTLWPKARPITEEQAIALVAKHGYANERERAGQVINDLPVGSRKWLLGTSFIERDI